MDIQQEGFPTDEEVALTVHHGGVVHGHFVLTAASQIVRPTQEQLRVAVLLADQVGTALTSHSG